MTPKTQTVLLECLEDLLASLRQQNRDLLKRVNQNAELSKYAINNINNTYQYLDELEEEYNLLYGQYLVNLDNLQKYSQVTSLLAKELKK